MGKLSSSDSLLTLVAAAGVFAFSCVAASATDGPVVRISTGELAGKVRQGAEIFLGIPYAAPPVGKLRWMPPAPAASWAGTRDATTPGSKCPQNGWVPPIVKYRDENCLFANVYRPAGTKAGDKLPVFFWIHGGGFVAGSSNDYDGSIFAERQKVIVVTMNYRLGVFGFATVKQLQQKDPNLPTGNYAVQDEQAALRWVQKNIGAFGGDPQKVTIGGQSAGGGSMWLLLVSPASEGLFRGVISTSAGGQEAKPLAYAQTQGPSAKLIANLGCGTAADIPACLRAASTDDVFEAGGGPNTRWSGWSVVNDGITIPDSPDALIADGKFIKVPIMSGIVAQNGGFFVQWRLQMDGQGPWKAADYARSLKEMKDSDRIAAAYLVSNFKSPDEAALAVTSDQAFCGVARRALNASKYTASYFYVFDDPDAPATIYTAPGWEKGPFHGSDMRYTFKTGYPNEEHPVAPALTADQESLSTRIQDNWGRFIRTGKPDSSWQPGGSALMESPRGDHTVSIQDLMTKRQCAVFN